LPIRERLKKILQQGADYQIAHKEKTPLAHTVRTCRQLLKVEPAFALWLFVAVEGLEPTNNAAERAIRPAVLWRKNIAVFAGMRYTETAVMLIHQGFCCTASDQELL
jgi:hypothetical protein